MPFLRHLKLKHPKIAEKIERDSLNTRGAPWPKNRAGVQKRRNRQPHWTLKEGDQLYPRHYADYEICLEVARALTIHVYEMEGAPPCPPDIAKSLGRVPVAGTYTCPVCCIPLALRNFELAKQSRAEIETSHIDPKADYIHTPGNVAFAHRQCNIAQGERSVPAFLDWIRGILERHGKLT